jgi:hypothetical protein
MDCTALTLREDVQVVNELLRAEELSANGAQDGCVAAT